MNNAPQHIPVIVKNFDIKALFNARLRLPDLFNSVTYWSNIQPISKQIKAAIIGKYSVFHLIKSNMITSFELLNKYCPVGA